MKRVFWAVFAVGFLAVSCGGGGGNINKVKNGVFSGVDSTITVGQAFANDATLKGGEWKAYEKDGRQIVSYTVKFSPQQINAQRNRDNEKPNFAVAHQIDTAKNFAGWDYILKRLQPFEKEEQQQFKTAFESAYKEATHAPQITDFFHEIKDYSLYFDPWILERMDSFTYTYNSMSLSRDNVVDKVRSFCGTYNSKGGNFDDAYMVNFKMGSSVNYAGDPEFETALKNTAANYKEQYRIAMEKIDNAKKALENQDIDPLVTVKGGSIAFFFVMDQANKDAFNIGGMYFEEDLTLNCFNDKKVTWELEYTTPNKILEYIYKPASRGFDFL